MSIRSFGEDEIRWINEPIWLDESAKVSAKVSLISLGAVNNDPFVRIADETRMCVFFERIDFVL